MNKNLVIKPLATLVLIALLGGCSHHNMYEQTRERVPLAGMWEVRLDDGTENAVTDSMNLPGTTDIAQKGKYNEVKDETTFLSRKYTFEGQATYQKTINIPNEWGNRQVRLVMERTKPTILYIDGKEVGRNDDISTAQVYDLTAQLRPGQHTISIMVDNTIKAVPPQVYQSSHAYSSSTQTNWNGIIGDFYLESTPLIAIDDIQIYPDVDNNRASVKLFLSNRNKNATKGEITYYAQLQNSNTTNHTKSQKTTVNLQDSVICFDIDMGKRNLYWSEFSPTYYRLVVQLEAEGQKDIKGADFGMRKFATRGKQFVINDKVTFLRGKHDACVFPLIAHTAMDTESWRKYFRTAKEYGINHYRFHSWCPPEACFEAADIEGIYLQPELPIWGNIDLKDTTLCNYLLKEGDNLHRAYSNHPSFVMFALGNELWNDEGQSAFVSHFKKNDNRHLYAAGSNNTIGRRGPLPEEDYYTTSRVGEGPDKSYQTHARASFSYVDAYEGGYINNTYPNTTMNFSGAETLCPVPVIGHETGQYQVYPNYDEIKKYTGVLEPRNMEIFKQRLEAAGMGDQAKEFFLASGKWSAILYKADMEMNFRTPNWGGFQLLDLQDYPGQGSAYIGMLDAFMDSKGLITPEEWKESCNDVVVLFEADKYCFTNSEPLKGRIKLANYSQSDIKDKTVEWTINKKSGAVVAKGKSKIEAPQGSLSDIGDINYPLSDIIMPEQLTLTLKVPGTTYSNHYPLWVYPADATPQESDIIITSQLTPAILSDLKEGKKVLFNPSKAGYESQTVGGLFETDYWNYRMFKTICENFHKPVSPGTMGLLTDPEHPLFKDFPTDSHTNWQWYPIVKNSYPMILDQLSGYRPIVQVIDNIERNHRLGLVFELRVDNGKLLVCMADVDAMKEKPEGKQFYVSMLDYMNSSAFNPSYKLTGVQLQELFSGNKQKGEIKQLQNISY